MTDFTGCDQLREALVNRGFKIEIDVYRSSYNACNWYAYRSTFIPSRECEGNPGNPVQIVVRPFIRNEFENVEVDLTGEANGRWYKQLCYNIAVDQLIEKLPEIEAELVAAWSALRE